jgi:hypothetical protein
MFHAADVKATPCQYTSTHTCLRASGLPANVTSSRLGSSASLSNSAMSISLFPLSCSTHRLGSSPARPLPSTPAAADCDIGEPGTAAAGVGVIARLRMRLSSKRSSRRRSSGARASASSALQIQHSSATEDCNDARMFICSNCCAHIMP